MIYGYARVSTDGQSVDAQVKQLREAGAEKVFRETASGAQSDRAQLRRALDQLDKGDVLMVTRVDRLARSTRDLLNTVAAIAAKKAGFRSLGDAWADTDRARTPDAGRPRRAGGIRARVNRRPHRRGQGTRQGAGRKDGAQAEIDPPPAARGDQAARRQGRAGARDCSDLQCFSQHDLTAERMSAITA
jgi:Resolvase, N terminal domain